MNFKIKYRMATKKPMKHDVESFREMLEDIDYLNFTIKDEILVIEQDSGSHIFNRDYIEDKYELVAIAETWEEIAIAINRHIDISDITKQDILSIVCEEIRMA